MKIQLLQIITLLFILGCTPYKPVFILNNKDVEAQVMQLENNQLAYMIKKDGQIVIDTSLLGIIVNKKTLGSNSEIELVESTIDEFEYPILGVKRIAQHQANISKFQLDENNGYKWFLEFQVSEEGVAYRYVIPQEGKNKVYGDIISFKFHDKTKIWYFERNNDWKLKSHAGEWHSADISQMPTISETGLVQGLTLTCELPSGGCAMLAEADLFNYSGMRLEAIGNNTFKANFSEGEKGFEIEGELKGRIYPLANKTQTVFYEKDGETQSVISIENPDWENPVITDKSDGSQVTYLLVRHAFEFDLVQGHDYVIK